MEHKLSIRRARFRSMRPVMVIAVSVILLLAFTSPVSAKGDGNVGETMTVSGNSEFSDCNAGIGLGALFLTGDVEGCLTFLEIEDFSCDEMNGFDRYRESGIESFVGSLHGEPGEFETTYTLEATYAEGFCDQVNAGGFPFELQLTGGCDHTVIGESGSFEGVTGLITFFDVIPDPGVSGASNFLYVGTLTTPPDELLLYGTNADRTEGVALEGSTVSGHVYVWLSPLHPRDVASIQWVDFLVDGVQRHREIKSPYDMIGGGDDAATASWNTREVANGEVTVTAVIGLKDGSTRSVSATFDVAN